MYTRERYGWAEQTDQHGIIPISEEVQVDRSDCDHDEIIPVCTLGRGMGGQIRL